jgi:hypothetical protein
MTNFALERNGSLVNQVVFIGKDSLYRDYKVLPITFNTIKAANEVADVLEANVVDYQLYLSPQLLKAA